MDGGNDRLRGQPLQEPLAALLAVQTADVCLELQLIASVFLSMGAHFPDARIFSLPFHRQPAMAQDHLLHLLVLEEVLVVLPLTIIVLI